MPCTLWLLSRERKSGKAANVGLGGRLASQLFVSGGVLLHAVLLEGNQWSINIRSFLGSLCQLCSPPFLAICIMQLDLGERSTSRDLHVRPRTLNRRHGDAFQIVPRTFTCGSGLLSILYVFVPHKPGLSTCAVEGVGEG